MIDGVTSDVQPVRAGVVLGVTAAYAGVLALVWGVLLRSRILVDVAVATHGLIQPTLINSAALALCVVAVLLLSGVPLRTLGLRRRDVPRALALLVVLYGATQLAIIAAVLVRGDPLVAAQRDPADTIGLFIAQLFGNAPVEETVFRGFLFRQFVARARLRGGTGRILAATAAAAILFGLCHIPLRIHQGYHGLDLAASLLVASLGGVLASYLYVRSGNLLILVVLHTLFNFQAPLFASPVPPQWLFCVVAIGAIAWIELTARRRNAHTSWRPTPP